jgi:hypothetical protein
LRDFHSDPVTHRKILATYPSGGSRASGGRAFAANARRSLSGRRWPILRRLCGKSAQVCFSSRSIRQCFPPQCGLDLRNLLFLQVRPSRETMPGTNVPTGDQ